MITDGSPRSIGRAGTGTVADDGGGALLVNPAALARRTVRRAQVGIAIIDDSIDWRDASDSVVERDQGGSRAAPFVVAVGEAGNFVIGAAAMTSAVSARAFASPGSTDPTQYGSLFDARYAGLAGSLRRDTVTIGAARRVTDTLAFGISIAELSGVSIVEGSPRVACRAGGSRHRRRSARRRRRRAHRTRRPRAERGPALYAPASVPLEFGGSIAWAATAHTAGSVVATGVDGGPTIASTAPAASLDIAQPCTQRAGARVGSAIIEQGSSDGDLGLFAASAGRR